MVSLTLYNRRQRTLWIEKELETLNQARLAQASGTASTEQLELIKKEEIAEIVKRKREEEKAQRPWAKAKRFLFEKMNSEDAGAGAATAVETSVAAEKADPARPGVVDAAKAKKAFDEARVGTGSANPGQLDVMAANVERAARETTRSWTSWLTGR